MRFLLGNFGTGKTSCILKEVLELIQEQETFWIIVPSTRHKNQLYSELLKKTTGIIGSPILTLLDLHHLLLKEVFPNPIDRPQTLSNFDKFLIISNIIQNNRSLFRAFKNINHRPKMIKMIYRIIQSLREKNIEKLSSTPHLEDRIHDLQIILDEFKNILSSKNLCDSRYEVDLICQLLHQSNPSFLPKYIFIDGFIDFTPHQFNIISALMKFAETNDSKVTISLTSNNHSICQNTIDQFYRLFPDGLIDSLVDEHPSNIIINKFLSIDCIENQNISIHEIQAFGKHKEIEEVVNQIKKLCHLYKYSLNDILIITKQQDIYAPLFSSILKKTGIPFSMSKDLVLSENPLILFIKKLLLIAQNNISHETLEFLAHSNYVSGDIQSILIEAPNLIPSAIIGKEKEWLAGFEHLENQDSNTDRLKKLIISICQKIYSFDINKKYEIKFFIDYIRELLEFFNVENSLHINISQENFHPLIVDSISKDFAGINKLKEIFINMQKSLSQIDEKMISLKRFLLYFDTITSETRYRNNTPKNNILKILTPEDARGIFAKAVFIIGMNEGEFPSPHRHELFDNNDRHELNKVSKKILGKSLWITDIDYFTEEKLSFITALSRATEQIFFSRTPCNEKGSYFACSHFLRKILEQNKSFNRIPEVVKAPVKAQWDNPRIFELMYEPKHYYEPSFISNIEKNNSEQVSESIKYINSLNEANDCFKNKQKPSVHVESYFGIISQDNPISKIFQQHHIAISPTKLERLGKCRYQALWQDLLKLTIYKLPNYSPESLDYGNLYHYVLEHYIKDTKELIDKDKNHTLLKQKINEFIAASPYQKVFEIDFQYILSILSAYLENIEPQIVENHESLYFELVSGDVVLKNTTLPLNKDTSLIIRSKIDRINKHSDAETYQIIDYKKKGSSYSEYQKTPFNLFQGFLYAILLQLNNKGPVDNISYVLLENQKIFCEYPVIKNKNLSFNSINEFYAFKQEEILQLISLLKKGDFSPFTLTEDVSEELITKFQEYITDSCQPEFKNKCGYCDLQRLCLRKQKLISYK